MSYFYRLTDIVTCDLSDLLAKADDPRKAIDDIIGEMMEGLTGAQRSVQTVAANEQRLREEISRHQTDAERWTEQAKSDLAGGKDSQARTALLRKREIENLIAGLEQQYEAASHTHQQLRTTLRALEARIAEARRRRQDVTSDAAPAASESVTAGTTAGRADTAEAGFDSTGEIEAELEALRRQLNQ